MSNLTKNRYLLTHPTPEYYTAITALCKKVYPFSEPWVAEQMEAHQTYFPDGQLIVIDKKNNKVVGLAFSLIILWDDYSQQDNWRDFTSGGFFHNHNPKKGKTLYGAEVMVDPDYRGQGIGKILYKARQAIAKKYKLKRIRAGARIRGYSKYNQRMSPEEYTQHVVKGKINDPTLSFQISQGFVVLDIAKNYLLNDPETLGYAAVIEWLNPSVATKHDYEKQNSSVQYFLENQKYKIEYLPRELRRLVRKMITTLGEVIRESEGDELYYQIEHYREYLKKFRLSDDSQYFSKLLKQLEKHKPSEQYKIAHAFALLLELINVCETAYRTWRQSNKSLTHTLAAKIELHFVLTAHPTEARANQIQPILKNLINLFILGLNNDFMFRNSQIVSLIRLLWNCPLVKTHSPSVMDEATYIYSIIFSPYLFDYILSNKESYTLKLSTWVGGDKDGHPGVNQDKMLACLTASRNHLINTIQTKLTDVIQDLKQLIDSGHPYQKQVMKIKGLSRELNKLATIKIHDGKKVTAWKRRFTQLSKSNVILISKHYQIKLIKNLIEMFPAFVLPIELREDATEIKKALQNRSASIYKMLSLLSKISSGAEITDYADSFIISHCMSAEDMFNAGKLVAMASDSKKLTIVPLFEDKEALESSTDILSNWLESKQHLRQVKQQWHSRLEIMLGYSDSAKQIGILPSRYLIQSSMFAIEKLLKQYKLTPTFFHGSGGSVARGGGRISEQIAWWPNSAIEFPKLTIQGEMIQRTFATTEILNAYSLHLSNEARVRKSKTAVFEKNQVLEKFSNLVEANYRALVEDDVLLPLSLDATPYHYLSALKIGSRPSKRPSLKASLSGLRAIPWVLCWTQSRLLLPTWWGVGSAWISLSNGERAALVQLNIDDHFFSSFIKALGFTLAKVDLGVWEQYLIGKYGKQKAAKIMQPIESEFKRSVKCVQAINQSKHLITHKPWLEESIRMRSPYVHILNLLQIIAMQKGDEKLLKETVVGIACGMLTTG